jgi:hypothetical protein
MTHDLHPAEIYALCERAYVAYVMREMVEKHGRSMRSMPVPNLQDRRQLKRPRNGRGA